MNWKNKALEILNASLTPIPHELSELIGSAVYPQIQTDLLNISVPSAIIVEEGCLHSE